MLNAVFIGNAEALRQAFPESLRRQLGNLVTLQEAEIRGDAWREHQKALGEANILLGTWGMPRLDDSFLQAAPNLKAIFYAAGTVKSFVTREFSQLEIPLSSARDANAIPVAEYVSGAVLLSLKRFWRYASNLESSRTWSRSLEVVGGYRSKVGFVSMGAVSRRVVRILSACDVNLFAYDPFLSPEEASQQGVTLLSLKELFSHCDVISIHAPLLPETVGLIDRGLLESMKPGATLINTSRGAIIDEKALCDVLRSREDLTAILDVTDPEPPSRESALFSLANAIVTPHIAGSMNGEIERLGQYMYDDLSRFLAGNPLHYRVDLAELGRIA